MRRLLKNNSKYPISRILGLNAVWWSFWALVQFFVLHRLGLSWHMSAVDAAISSLLLGFFCFDAVAIFYYYQPGKNNRAYRFIFAVGITILFCISDRWFLTYLFPDDMEYQHFLHLSMPVRFVFGLLIISFVTLANWMWNNMQEQKEREKRQRDAEQLVKEAELVKLRQQLQPHFLFNSLNSISALVGSKPQEARKMIQQLSDFLRGTLRKDDQQTVLLRDELEHLKLYLEIEKVRFGHRLNIEMNFRAESLNAKIPPLLIQPIVENAIKFGLYDRVDEITIYLTSEMKEDFLHIIVKNPFDSETQVTQQGTGFGLSSLQRRLLLLYTRNDLLNTEMRESQFIVTLKVPQIL